MSMKIHFLGGVDTVTGSCHIVEAGGRRVLRDCGLYQGRRAEAFARNRGLAFDPATLDAVVLSHAHIDHCGNLPTLARAGYRGPVHATTATARLCEIMLLDAAHIQEQDAVYLNQKTNRRKEPPVVPLYVTADAERTLTLLQGHHYGAPVEVAPGLRVSFRDAGHILGAALNVFESGEDGRRTRAGFAFDLGRSGLPLIRDPEPLPAGLDVLVLESTYGNRRHDPAADAAAQLGRVVRKTLERGGKVFVPTFALERAQEILYHLSQLVADGALPRVPVFVDSPMASAVTRVFQKSAEYMDDEFRELRDRMGCVLAPPWVTFSSTVEQSKAITARDRPCVVLAASGMCEHGRILHHLKHGIGNPLNAIVFVGYQAEHTLGRRIVSGESRVRIFGDEHTVRAEVHRLDAFSGHADVEELVAYARAVSPRRIYLVHGEADSRAALADRLRKERFDAILPLPGETVEIDGGR